MVDVLGLGHGFPVEEAEAGQTALLVGGELVYHHFMNYHSASLQKVYVLFTS